MALHHSRASARGHDDDSDSGPEQVVTATAPTRRQPGPSRVTHGGGARQAETPEQRMLRRMEAAPSDDSDETASGSLKGAPGGSDSDGGGSEMPSDVAAAQLSDTFNSGDSGDSNGRDGDSGASPSSDTNMVSGTSALSTLLSATCSSEDCTLACGQAFAPHEPHEQECVHLCDLHSLAAATQMACKLHGPCTHEASPKRGLHHQMLHGMSRRIYLSRSWQPGVGYLA